MKIKVFDNVWDAIEDDPAVTGNLKLRSLLMIELERHIKREKWTQAKAVKTPRRYPASHLSSHARQNQLLRSRYAGEDGCRCRTPCENTGDESGVAIRAARWCSLVHMRRFFVLLLASFCAFTALAQSRLPITEKIEWTWTDRPEAPTAGLPNVLLVGDSITRAYYPEVAKDLSGVANVYLFATSAASGDPRLPGQLRDYFSMMGVTFAAIHFNNGMHGWGYTEQQYAAGLPGMIDALRNGAPQAVLVWASTTPVLHDPAEGGATNARIDERNRLAAALMSRNAIAIDDQHALMLAHQDLHNGDVHFTEQGSATQAVQVAAILRTALASH